MGGSFRMPVRRERDSIVPGADILELIRRAVGRRKVAFHRDLERSTDLVRILPSASRQEDPAPRTLPKEVRR